MKDAAGSSSLFSTHLVVAEEKKKCLAKVVKVFQDLENSQQQDYQEISNLLQLHDDLCSLLPQEKGNDNDCFKIQQSLSRYFLQLRLEKKTNDNKSSLGKELEDSWKKQLFEYLAIEGDLYRAMALTSMHLMQSLPMAINVPLSETVQEGLRSCVQRSQLLLKIIDQRVQSALDANQDEIAMNNLLEHYTTDYYEKLEGWLLEYDSLEGEENNIIAFDKEQLQLEEEELMHMASTPTPNEAESSTPPAQSSELSNDLTSLSARLIQEDAASSNAENDSTDKSPNTSQYSSLVTLYDKGVFRCQHPQEQAWWWLLTSESSVQCDANHQTITILSVFSNRPKLTLLPSIQLQVKAPEEVSLWWSRISRFVQSMQQEKDLQKGVTSLWPSSEVEAKLQQARTIIITTN